MTEFASGMKLQHDRIIYDRISSGMKLQHDRIIYDRICLWYEAPT
jgi:hypothetical protein